MTEFESKELPLDIKSMLNLQNENVETVVNQMQMYWRTPITEVIRDNLNAKFNFQQTELDKYKTDPIKRFLTNIDLFLHEQLRTFTKDNIEDLVEFVRKFCTKEDEFPVIVDKTRDNVLTKRLSRVSGKSEKLNKDAFSLSDYLIEKNSWQQQLKHKWEKKEAWKED